MTDRMTAGEEARKKKDKDDADRAKRQAMRDIVQQCEKAYQTIAGRTELDMMVSESESVGDDGSCALTFTVDMDKLKHPNKQEMNERKGLFYQSISVFKDAFEDLAPRRKLTPFTLLILGRDGAVIKRVDVK